MWLLRVAAVLCLLSAARCASPLDGNYAGQDAGTLIVGVGTLCRGNFELQFRRLDGTSDGSLAWTASGPGRGPAAFVPPDFHGDDGSGWVLVRNLPPGDYELYNAAARTDGQVWTNRWVFPGGGGFRLKEDFSVRFTIAPHQATYLGRYLGWFQATFVRDQISGGFLLVVSDHAQEDVAAARRAHGQIGSVLDASPDPNTAKVPVFFSPQRFRKLMNRTADAT